MEVQIENLRNVAIIAHVDAAKQLWWMRDAAAERYVSRTPTCG